MPTGAASLAAVRQLTDARGFTLGAMEGLARPFIAYRGPNRDPAHCIYTLKSRQALGRRPKPFLPLLLLLFEAPLQIVQVAERRAILQAI